MQDRVPLYPGRVKLTPVSGQENTYDMVRADEPTQEGTPLSKATFLKDDTAALFGLGADAVPDDVFKTLGSELSVTTEAGVVVTASKGNVNVSKTTDSSGLAVLKIPGFGTWTVSATINGIVISAYCEIKAIAQYELALSTNLETARWDIIDSISKSGKASSIWSVGDKKTINVNGTDYQFQIIGFNHDDKTAGGKAGITFQMVDCLNTSYNMNGSATNVGGWKDSAMRTRMNTFLDQLPPDLQSVIKTVNKQTSVGNFNSTIETVSDKLFLLSEIEVFGSTTYSFSGEGSQYDWYKAGNTKIKKANNSVITWFERSPYKDYAFCAVDNSGNASYSHANNNRGVSFAFCV